MGNHADVSSVRYWCLVRGDMEKDWKPCISSPTGDEAAEELAVAFGKHMSDVRFTAVLLHRVSTGKRPL